MLKSIHEVKRLIVAVIGFSVLAAFAVMMIRTGLTEWAGLYLRN